MERIIKSLPAENGELYVTSAGQRRALARFTGVVEIRETQMLVPLLGATEKGTKRIYASFVVCGDIDYQMEIPDGFIHSGKVFDAVADIDGRSTILAGLRFADSDPIKNELVFEITDTELIQKLLTE